MDASGHVAVCSLLGENGGMDNLSRYLENVTAEMVSLWSRTVLLHVNTRLVSIHGGDIGNGVDLDNRSEMHVEWSDHVHDLQRRHCQ